jgi:hypothetical protein
MMTITEKLFWNIKSLLLVVLLSCIVDTFNLSCYLCDAATYLFTRAYPSIKISFHINTPPPSYISKVFVNWV